MRQFVRRGVRRLAEHKGFRRYFKNTSWILGGQAFRMFIGLVVNIAVARHLGREDFGTLNFVMAIVAILTPLTSVGLNHILRKETVEEPEKRDELLGTWYGICLVATLAVVSCLLAVLWLLGLPRQSFELYLILSAGLFGQPLLCVQIWFFSQVRAQLSVIATSVTLLILGATRLVLIYLDAELRWFALCVLLETVLIQSICLYTYKKHYASPLLWRFDWGRARHFLSLSWPLIISGLAMVLFTKIDQVILGALVSKAEVGEYAAAARISQVWTFVPSMLATSLFTAIINAKNRDETLFWRRLQSYFDLSAVLGLAIALPISLFSPLIINILYGQEFAGAASILAVQIWGNLLIFLSTARMQYLVAENLLRFSMVSTGLGALMNIGLNLLLVPEFEGVGAAWASIISQGFVVFGTTLAWPPTRRAAMALVLSLFFFLRLHRLKP
ncbi:MAG: flippase [Opitutales bacterium]